MVVCVVFLLNMFAKHFVNLIIYLKLFFLLPHLICLLLSLTYQTKKKIIVMAAYYLPSILVPLVGLVFPALTMGALFLYIEKEDVV